MWVPAHADIPGNERSDRMAKEALKLNFPNITAALSRMEGKSIIKEACNQKWQMNWNECKTGRHLYNIHKTVRQSNMTLNLSREDQVILSRLRMGHTKLNSTLYIIRTHGTGCQVKETVEHVLVFCPKYDLERNELIRELQGIGCKVFTINSLLNIKPGSVKIVRLVLKFIKHSGLRNRI